ncbi:MAG: hypothetical protein WC369_03835 [Dehalococcoidales bacterium]|jgi:hypothetical protein
MVIALLMGRKGSKGFPGKNLYPVRGNPLAYYPMKAAKDCADIDKSYISTDDEELMGLASKNGIETIIRPPELLTDAALGEDVYVHGYKVARERNKGKDIDIIVLLMCNAPMVSAAILSEGIRVLRKNPEYDSAVTVSRYNMWSPLRARRVGNDGLLYPFIPFETIGDPEKLNCDRDSQGDVWFADMGASIVRARCLEDTKSGFLPQKWMGRKIYPLKQDAGLDVDYEWQLPQVEYWLDKQRNGQNE